MKCRMNRAANGAFLKNTPSRQALNFLLCLILCVNLSACNGHKPTNGNHTNIPPTDIDVFADLLGVAAEIGTLLLVKKPLVATMFGGTAGALVKYTIKELGLECKACGNHSQYQAYAAEKETPAEIQCQSCNNSAYLVVSDTWKSLKSLLEKFRAENKPTCLLTQEKLSTGRFRLSWKSHNATDASLNGERVSIEGEREIAPQETTIYLLKVIGKYGAAESRLTIVVTPLSAPAPAAPAAVPPLEPAPPAPESNTSQPQPPPVAPPPSQRFAFSLLWVKVYEDGSLGRTDWSFTVFVNDKSLMLLPQSSYRDRKGNVVVFNGIHDTEAFVSPPVIHLHITGKNFDANHQAQGYAEIPMNDFSSFIDQDIEVSVPTNPRRGTFVFRIRINKL